ncbi:LysR substrate-binding domain-containing protein [Paenalcaligenes niemegkensis]|uniref:LysR substrate-binding domain-containing protein n=1 Tax=Paenalcaligenes niemegkensis TaxID=2895469 RepID=UPI001EE91D69|nr:LysR substrate-binding domain-containing protein [Paenalcaligenes niemegkensis]MCQ9617517.1 LysR substrate-binding domain-containing protein [Paenalcaligenes niemegkensis]
MPLPRWVAVGDSGAVAQWVASSYCDLGISAYVTEMPGMGSTKIETLQGVCVVPEGHPLASVDRAITIDDFEGHPFIALPLGDGTRRNIDAVFNAHGEDFRPIFYECPYAAAICMMVGLGMGVSIVNPLVAKSCLHTGIVVKPLVPQVAFSYYILSSSFHLSSELALDIHHIVEQELRRNK